MEVVKDDVAIIMQEVLEVWSRGVAVTMNVNGSGRHITAGALTEFDSKYIMKGKVPLWDCVWSSISFKGKKEATHLREQ